ncbi:spermidine synthase family protein [Halochromatium sp.]
MSEAAPRPLHLVTVGALAGSVLAFEVVLLRLFEFSHWHHFAGLTIALALLGFGASGTLLSVIGERAGRFGDRWLVLSLLVAAAGFLLVLLLHAWVALRPLMAVWDASELLRLLAIDFAAFIPFFGAGLALGQVFARWPRHAGWLYAANLGGSGIGTLLATLLLVAMLPEAALALIAALLLGFCVLFSALRRIRVGIVSAALLLVAASWLALSSPEPAISDFKALSRVLALPDAQRLEQRPGLAGRLTLVRSSSLRSAPGLSLNWTGRVLASDAAIVGSDRLVPIERDYRQVPSYSEASLAALPLQLRPSGRVAVLGSGTWATPSHAVDRALTWVEPDDRLPALAIERGLNADAMQDSPYRFLNTNRDAFAVIALDRTFDGSGAATEDYLLTRQGLRAALARLDNNGLLAIPLKLDYPPRQGPRMLATLAASLRALGVDEPADHVVALRGMQALLILVSPQPLTDTDLDLIRSFAERWSFDRVWHPGLAEQEVNRYHLLDTPIFFEAAQAVFGDTAMPEQARWFETGPVGIARPYFWHAMQWSTIPQLFEMLGTRAASYLDWTLVMSAVTLVAATLAAALLILAPLGRMPPASAAFTRAEVIGYFGLLGFGFMLIELAMLQRMTAFVELPVLAAAVIFTLFMIGAGIGSAMPPRQRGADALRPIFRALAIGGGLAILALWWPGQPLLALPLSARIMLLAALLLPMTWAMGRPFPWALQHLVGTPSWQPWSWAINGFASVLAASTATLLSVQAGQPVTLLAGIGCYLGAWLIARRGARRLESVVESGASQSNRAAAGRAAAR